MPDFPHKFDAVWVPARRDAGLQPNGYVLDVDFDAEEVIVQFYDADWDSFDLGSFMDAYTTRFGGGWWIDDIPLQMWKAKDWSTIPLKRD